MFGQSSCAECGICVFGNRCDGTKINKFRRLGSAEAVPATVLRFWGCREAGLVASLAQLWLRDRRVAPLVAAPNVFGGENLCLPLSGVAYQLRSNLSNAGSADRDRQAGPSPNMITASYSPLCCRSVGSKRRRSQYLPRVVEVNGHFFVSSPEAAALQSQRCHCAWFGGPRALVRRAV